MAHCHLPVRKIIANISRLSLDLLSPRHDRHLQLQGYRVPDHCRVTAIKRTIEDTDTNHPKVQLVSQSLGKKSKRLDSNPSLVIDTFGNGQEYEPFGSNYR